MGNTYFITAICIYSGLVGSISGTEAGIKVRIQENGFEYLKDTLLDLLMEILVTIRMPPLKFQQLDIEDIKVVGMMKPRKVQVILTPSDTIAFTLENFNIRAKGKFSGVYIVPISSGEFDATASRIKMRQNLRVQDENGMLSIKPEFCYIQISEIDIDLKNFVYNLFRNRVAEELKVPLAKRFCSVISDVISGISNSSLQSLPRLFPLSKFSGESEILKKYLENLYLDYRLVDVPRVYPSQLQLDFSGEVSWKGKGRTTLERNPVNFLNPGLAVAKPKMISAVLSDYVLNSMFESMHRNTKLSFEVDRRTHPKVGNLLRTTCDDALDDNGALLFCIGDLLEGLAEKFPDKNLGFRFTPREPPKVSFRPDVINFESNGPLIMYYIQNNDTVDIARSILDISFDAQVSTFPNGTFGVNISDADIKIKAGSSSFDTSQEEFDIIGDFASSSLQEVFGELTMFNELPLPIEASMKLIDPVISVRDGAIDIITDLEIDRMELLKVIQELMNENVVLDSPEELKGESF